MEWKKGNTEERKWKFLEKKKIESDHVFEFEYSLHKKMFSIRKKNVYTYFLCLIFF